jgi:hypothetical protein
MEKFWRWLAWKLPRPLVYWCVARAGAYATQGKYENTIVPELTLIDTLQRWREE